MQGLYSTMYSTLSPCCRNWDLLYVENTVVVRLYLVVIFCY